MKAEVTVMLGDGYEVEVEVFASEEETIEGWVVTIDLIEFDEIYEPYRDEIEKKVKAKGSLVYDYD